MTATAHFAAARSELIVVEHPAQPNYANGRQIGVTPGKYHYFTEHRATVTGQKSIDFMRERMKAPDGPDLWEIDADDVPAVNSLLAELATAPTDRVREILAAEQSGPARTEILEVARRVLERSGVSEQKPGGMPARSRHETVQA